MRVIKRVKNMSPALTKEVNLVTESSAHSGAETKEPVRELQSYSLEEELDKWTYKYQSQPTGFETPGNDDSSYSCSSNLRNCCHFPLQWW